MNLNRKYKKSIRIRDEKLRTLSNDVWSKMTEFGYSVKLQKSTGYDSLIFTGLDAVDLKFLCGDLREAYREVIREQSNRRR